MGGWNAPLGLIVKIPMELMHPALQYWKVCAREGRNAKTKGLGNETNSPYRSGSLFISEKDENDEMQGL